MGQGANSRIGYDADKCVGCGACVKTCPVAAVFLAKTKAEAEKIQSEIDTDPRRPADLFVDRYSGDICETMPADSDKVLELASKISGLVVLELYDEETLHCLVASIPMSEIFSGIKYTHIKSRPDEKLREQLGVSELPAMIFFSGGRQIGKFEGYFDNLSAEKDFLISKVRKIIS